MLIPTGAVSSALTLEAGSMPRPTLPQSTTSFAQQLAESLESYLSQATAGSRVEIDILPSASPNSATRQFLITVKDPSSTGSAKSAAAAPASPIDVSGMLMFSGIPDPAKDTGPTAPTIKNAVDAYWAAQPEEVQVLRTIDDWTERGEMGWKLAQQGFVIDPNIMLHRWDPYMTMKGRMEEGYTWVPSVGQDGIPVSPGLTFPGLPSYDAGNPPRGAVLVSLDWAKGFEHTVPGWQPGDVIPGTRSSAASGA